MNSQNIQLAKFAGFCYGVKRAVETAKKLKIEDVLPILIAEKTGPHFAFGDTCFSYQEDIKTYNPDGKEIIAKEKKSDGDPWFIQSNEVYLVEGINKVRFTITDTNSALNAVFICRVTVPRGWHP